MRRLAALLFLLAAMAVPGPAGAAVYWGHEDTFGVVNFDGSSLTPSINSGFTRSCGVAVSSSHLYWSVASNNGTIGRSNLDGTSIDEALVSGLGFPCGIAVDAGHVYWADRDTNLIGRANFDGSGVQRGFIGGADDPCGIAVDGSHVYWSNLGSGTIGRAKLDGSEIEQDFIVGAIRPCGLAVTSTQVYWTTVEWDASTPSGIGRAPLGGGLPENHFIASIGEAFSLAASPTHLYWTDEGWRNFQGGGNPAAVLPGAVGRARLDGTEVERRWIPTGLARGIAVDSRVLPPALPPAPRPSDYLHFGKLTRDSRTGALQVIVHVPARGEFRVNSPRIGWRIDKGNPPPWMAGTFRWKLKLWPGKGTPAAKRIHRQLRKNGKASIALRVTYQQEGRLPLEASKRLTFMRPRR